MKPFKEYQNALRYPSKADFTTTFWYSGGVVIAKKEGSDPVITLVASAPELSTCVSEKIENAKAYKKACEEYGAETARLTEAFRQDLFEDLGIKNHPMRDKLFSKAWEDGHSSGFAEVHNCACNLVELIELPKGSILITPTDILLENVRQSGQVQIYELAEKLQEMLQ